MSSLLLAVLITLPVLASSLSKESLCEELSHRLWQRDLLLNVTLLNDTLSQSRRNKCSIDTVNYDGDSALMITVAEGLFDGFNLLLSWGASVNVVNNLGFTPLHTACAKNRTEFALALLPLSAVGLKAENGMTAFLYSCRMGNVRLLDEFLRVRVMRGTRDGRGSSCLHLAVVSGSEGAVSLLLSNGFDVNAVDSERRRTPLMLAIQLGNEGVIKALLRHHPELHLKDFVGKRALEYAYSSRNQRIVDLMREAYRLKSDL